MKGSEGCGQQWVQGAAPARPPLPTPAWNKELQKHSKDSGGVSLGLPDTDRTRCTLPASPITPGSFGAVTFECPFASLSPTLAPLSLLARGSRGSVPGVGPGAAPTARPCAPLTAGAQPGAAVSVQTAGRNLVSFYL